MAGTRAVAVAAVTALAALALYAAIVPGTPVPEGIEISATYEDGTATITYSDSSGGTEGVVMEILGMEETFHRTYGSDFVEEVGFAAPPRHGWAVHPVVLDITHSEHGEIRLKTEIRGAGEPPAPVIVSP